jgi:protein phosphatase
MTWYVTTGAATDTGRVREANEDAYLIAPPMYAVADGMGGHAGGEVASALALETLRVAGEGAEDSDLAAGVREANQAEHRRQADDADLAGMGTTLTALIVDDAGIRLAHVGDSRAYLLRGRELTQITQDHTLVRELVEEGQLTQEQAREHPQRSMLTRAVGIDAEVDLDEAMIKPHEGDRLMLCSDGLTGMVTDDQIKHALIDRDDPQNAADALVAMANAAGGVDNTTVLILDLSETPPPAAGVDPTTGLRTNARSQADDIVIHGRDGIAGFFTGRSPLAIVGAVIGVLVVLVLLYFLAT